MAFPKPYTSNIPEGGDRSLIEYPPFDKMDIGARSSGLPKGEGVPNGIKSIDHVGKTTGKGK